VYRSCYWCIDSLYWYIGRLYWCIDSLYWYIGSLYWYRVGLEYIGSLYWSIGWSRVYRILSRAVCIGLGALYGLGLVPA
jgi:hypothetical protein